MLACLGYWCRFWSKDTLLPNRASDYLVRKFQEFIIQEQSLSNTSCKPHVKEKSDSDCIVGTRPLFLRLYHFVGIFWSISNSFWFWKIQTAFNSFDWTISFVINESIIWCSNYFVRKLSTKESEQRLKPWIKRTTISKINVKNKSYKRFIKSKTEKHSLNSPISKMKLLLPLVVGFQSKSENGLACIRALQTCVQIIIP